MNRWRRMAYLARYAKQQISELKKLTLVELALFERAIGEIVKAENPKR